MDEGDNHDRLATIAQLRATIASVEEQWHSDQKLAQPAFSDEISDLGQAKKIALRYMSTRPRSSWEVSQEMRRRHVIDPVADQVIERFTQVSLLDDRGFAKQWVSTRRGSKSLSLARLRHELTAKGIAADLIAEALDDAEESEADLALALARRRVASMRGHDQNTLIRRLSSQLERRGFAPGVVRAAVFQVVDETLGATPPARLGNIADDE
ncbi:MAG: recombination regulator RecX [Propionibacteriaceae bacterium]|nr:recombination regulator RecX [Propionibacteriaceae bacterium]